MSLFEEPSVVGTHHAGMEGATQAKMLCVHCGSTIEPNATSMCLQCLSSRIDITEGISTQLTVHRCRGCERWLKPNWITADLESPELLGLCIKKVRGLQRVKLVDAQWIWTEAHSMRLKIRLTIQKEVLNGAILQQVFEVEYVIRNKQCEDCAKQYTDGTWTAVVQVRQRVDHKRTFYYLEQLLLKNDAHSKALSIQSFRDGMDFYFAHRNEAQRFAQFLANVVPVKVKHSKKLVGMDNHSNITNNKYTYMMAIVPLCKDDLVILPQPLARHLGDISPLVLVERVSSLVHVVDPVSCERATFDVDAYTKSTANPDSSSSLTWDALMQAPQLVEYVVLGTEAVANEARSGAASQGSSAKTRLAQVEVARSSDLGSNDVRYQATTHLGHLLSAGDTVLGYDLASTQSSLSAKELTRAERHRAVPDVVLVRKLYGADSKKRGWQLRKLEVDNLEVGPEGPRRKALEEEGEDYERFMQQLEADKEMRKTVALYNTRAGDDAGGAAAMAVGGAGSGQGQSGQGGAAEDEEAVQLDELLSGFTLRDEYEESKFKVDEDDAAFLSGKFVFAPEDGTPAAQQQALVKEGLLPSPKQQQAAAQAKLRDAASPPKFNFT